MSSKYWYDLCRFFRNDSSLIHPNNIPKIDLAFYAVSSLLDLIPFFSDLASNLEWMSLMLTSLKLVMISR